MDRLVSPKSKLLIQTILTDSKIAEKVFENAEDKAKYKICTIDDNGTIVMGKTRVRWWNQLLNCQTPLTFESFALKVWDALVDLSSGINNEAIMKGLSHEIVMNSVRRKEYDWVVGRLFDCWTHVAQKSEGYQMPQVLPEGSSVQNQDHVHQVVIEKPVPVPASPNCITINIDGKKNVIPFQDSIGDTLNLGLEVGIMGVRKLR